MRSLKIAALDKDRTLLKTYKDYIESDTRSGIKIDTPHQVVILADSFDGALPQIESCDQLDVAVVDLDPGDHVPHEHDETHDVVWLLRDKFKREIRIITVLASGELPAGADTHMEKDLANIRAYIDEISRKR
jgi:hypothetical protein